MVESAPDGRTDGPSSAPRLTRTWRWWVDLDRGWRASIIGLLAVAAVVAF